MAVKRRVIWMTDDEWTLLRSMAEARNGNVSDLIRSMWADAAAAKPATAAEKIEVQAAQERFNSRPFTPVPKK